MKACCALAGEGESSDGGTFMRGLRGVGQWQRWQRRYIARRIGKSTPEVCAPMINVLIYCPGMLLNATPLTSSKNKNSMERQMMMKNVGKRGI